MISSKLTSWFTWGPQRKELSGMGWGTEGQLAPSVSLGTTPSSFMAPKSPGSCFMNLGRGGGLSQTRAKLPQNKPLDIYHLRCHSFPSLESGCIFLALPLMMGNGHHFPTMEWSTLQGPLPSS